MKAIFVALGLVLLASGICSASDDYWGTFFELDGITIPDSNVVELVVGQGSQNPLHLRVWQGEDGRWTGLAVNYRAHTTTLISDVSMS